MDDVRFEKKFKEPFGLGEGGGGGGHVNFVTSCGFFFFCSQTPPFIPL